MLRAFFFGVVVSCLVPLSGLSAVFYATEEYDPDSLYLIDVDSGTRTLVGATGVPVVFSGLAFDTSTGTLYVSDVSCDGSLCLGSVDRRSGEVTVIGELVNSINIHGLAYDSSRDVLFGCDALQDLLFTIDRDTGLATSVGPYGLTAHMRGLAYDADNDVLFGIAESGLYTLDEDTGAATLVGDHGMGSMCSYAGLEYDEATDTLYALCAYTLFVLDQSTGTITSGQLTDFFWGSGLALLPDWIMSDGFESGDLATWSGP